MKRKPVLKKETSQLKHAKQISHSSPDHPEQVRAQMSPSEDPAISVEFENGATEQQFGSNAFSMLQTAKPVVDPDDSMEYENELIMLEEFYHIQYTDEDHECGCAQLEGVEEEEIQEDNELLLKESQPLEAAPEMQEIFKP
jgi:hypothetical protein